MGWGGLLLQRGGGVFHHIVIVGNVCADIDFDCQVHGDECRCFIVGGILVIGIAAWFLAQPRDIYNEGLWLKLCRSVERQRERIDSQLQCWLGVDINFNFNEGASYGSTDFPVLTQDPAVPAADLTPMRWRAVIEVLRGS